MQRKAVTNEKNTKDHIGRGGKTVLAKHKGKLPRPPKHMGTRKGR
jgi:hypothetical protein